MALEWWWGSYLKLISYKTHSQQFTTQAKPLKNLLHLLILHFHTTTTTANNIYMRGSQHNVIVYDCSLVVTS